jgi:hypothetical protein
VPSAVGGLLLCNLFGDCVVDVTPKVNAPGPPKLIRREKLFDLPCVLELLLDVVDSDQRLRFPTPSLSLLLLFDRLCVLLGRRFDSGEVTGFEKFAVVLEALVGICAFCGAASGREVDRPGPKEPLRCRVRVEEDEDGELFV